MRPFKVYLAQVCFEEVCFDEVRRPKVCPAEVGSAEVRLAEVRLAEVRHAELRLDEKRPAKVRLAEVRIDAGAVGPPSIPRVNALPERGKVVWIGHLGASYGSPPCYQDQRGIGSCTATLTFPC